MVYAQSVLTSAIGNKALQSTASISSPPPRRPRRGHARCFHPRPRPRRLMQDGARRRRLGCPAPGTGPPDSSFSYPFPSRGPRFVAPFPLVDQNDVHLHGMGGVGSEGLSARDEILVAVLAVSQSPSVPRSAQSRKQQPQGSLQLAPTISPTNPLWKPCCSPTHSWRGPQRHTAAAPAPPFLPLLASNSDGFLLATRCHCLLPGRRPPANLSLAQVWPHPKQGSCRKQRAKSWTAREYSRVVSAQHQ